jgi:hypothetical protein
MDNDAGMIIDQDGVYKLWQVPIPKLIFTFRLFQLRVHHEKDKVPILRA